MRETRGKKVTRQQRIILEKHKKDPNDYLYISTNTSQEGKKRLDKVGVKSQSMTFFNVTTKQMETFDI